MLIEQLIQSSNTINEQIEALVSDESSDIYPIFDGIIDYERYISAKYKILWILKEPYDYFDESGTPSGGGWALNDVIKGKNSIYEFTSGKPTYIPMIYTSWGILNQFCEWSEMPSAENEVSVLDAFKSTAYINVKKLPGYKKSNDNTISLAYKKYRNILLNQVDTFSPNIIIGGNTLHNFYKDLDIHDNDIEKTRFKSLHYAIKHNRIYISAYHPSQIMFSQEVYCNEIINAVKIWAKT